MGLGLGCRKWRNRFQNKICCLGRIFWATDKLQQIRRKMSQLMMINWAVAAVLTWPKIKSPKFLISLAKNQFSRKNDVTAAARSYFLLPANQESRTCSASTWTRPNHMAHDIVISCKQVVLNNLSLTENVWRLPKVVWKWSWEFGR